MRLFTDNDVTVFVVAVLATAALTSCTNSPVDSKATIQLNPYGISESDLMSAQISLALAESEQQFLSTLGSPLVNPYGFSNEDVLFADSMQRVAAVHRNTWLDLGINVWDIWPPSQEQIDEGISYWEQVKIAIEMGDLPYWQAERDQALTSDHQQWQEFCDAMVELQASRLQLAGAMIADLQADEDVLNGISSGSGVRSRKADLFIQEIGYYSHAIDALGLGMQLEVPDWSGLEGVIANPTRTVEGISYWTAQETAVVDSAMPYWQDELLCAGEADDQYWIKFVQHMVGNLQDKLNLIALTVTDLRYDSALCVGLTNENPNAVAQRKQHLAEKRLAYYGDLVDVLLEGINLGIINQKVQCTSHEGCGKVGHVFYRSMQEED